MNRYSEWAVPAQGNMQGLHGTAFPSTHQPTRNPTTQHQLCIIINNKLVCKTKYSSICKKEYARLPNLDQLCDAGSSKRFDDALSAISPYLQLPLLAAQNSAGDDSGRANGRGRCIRRRNARRGKGWKFRSSMCFLISLYRCNLFLRLFENEGFRIYIYFICIQYFKDLLCFKNYLK